jgi:hypothetical protein
MIKATKEFKMPYELNGVCGSLKVEADYTIEMGYFGTKVDEVKEWHNHELEELAINEAYFIKAGGLIENKLSKAEINEVYQAVKIYVEENIEEFI